MSNTEYTFDIVAVATFHIGAPDYATARRAAEGLMEFDVANNAVSEGHDDPPGLTYKLTCVAPRGRASLVSAGDDDADMNAEGIPPGDYQDLAEPLLDARDTLKEALDEADEALGGDSNDAEHDALYSVRETIAGLLGVTYDAPSPDDDDETPHPDHGYVTLESRPGYHSYRVTLRKQEVGGYHTREIAIYELARAMAGDAEFTPAWITGEHGPAMESIEAEIYAHYAFSNGEGTLQPLPHTRFKPGDLVIIEGQDWQPWVIIGDYGDLGIQLHALGDKTVTCFIPGTDLDDVQPVRAD